LELSTLLSFATEDQMVQKIISAPYDFLEFDEADIKERFGFLRPDNMYIIHMSRSFIGEAKKDSEKKLEERMWKKEPLY
jgi:hypothetical protein